MACNCSKGKEWLFTWNGTEHGPFPTHAKAVAERRRLGATGAPLRQRPVEKANA